MLISADILWKYDEISSRKFYSDFIKLSGGGGDRRFFSLLLLLLYCSMHQVLIVIVIIIVIIIGAECSVFVSSDLCCAYGREKNYLDEAA
jgi:hypothetical protein